ncbi:hypothetical protein [Portibacter lacus]|uniref:Outer membrane protein beta-barrel domain-containing protein n=1 Tax=Portibacter lacus TaxID=1099794 RepID=A0AA37SLP1_9BACT|nr:hypothetical protein [Portibacter lacus]GLR15814.1 hypothetical protein GCM10007940_04290 [Portibacter lacus]
MKYILSILISLTLLTANAQRSSGDVGIGLQFGEPSGLSLNFYRNAGPTVDILAAWDLDKFFYVNAHALYYKHIGGSEYLHFIYGPGAFVGIIDNKELKDAIDLGISATGGLSMVYRQLEIYLRVTPRLALLDKTNVDLGGGLGVRLYF